MENKTDETGFAERLYNLPKYVVSTTLEDSQVEQFNDHQRERIAEEITKLKAQPGQDILVAGSATLAEMLRQHNLVDEYRLMVFPAPLGQRQTLVPRQSVS